MDPVSIAAILSIPTSVGFVVAAGSRSFKRWGRFMDRLDDAVKPDASGKSLSERLGETQLQVAEIKSQVFTNGGGSLRDSVDRAAALAKEAAEKASRAEIVGSTERADIRYRLNTIETKVDKFGENFSVHLAEANIEKRST